MITIACEHHWAIALRVIQPNAFWSENRTKRVCENSWARVVRVTVGARDVLLMLHSGPAATLKSLEPAHPLKHAPPPPLYREL